ncbi:MAG: hypothetical protein LQ349_004595 [Xanthoria aureola]|nr:MAG: hypothetical protein LQ349_004595 [Xanthoria aureola]
METDSDSSDSGLTAVKSSRNKAQHVYTNWHQRQQRRTWVCLSLVVFVTTLILALISLLIYFIINLRAQIPRNDIQRLITSWGKPGTPTEGRSHYPTEFSRGIIPIPCHSHNDYERRVPLYDALQAGCISVEADVWLRDGDLLVGHTQKSLTAARTLQSLYLDPLLSILARQNAAENMSESSSGHTAFPFAANISGIFETNTSVSLTLLVDIKTDGRATLPVIQRQLEPLREKGWLTHTSDSTLVRGPITIVGTGNTPFDQIQAEKGNRDIFFDAPLAQFWGEDIKVASTNRTVFNPQNSLYASAPFSEVIGKPWHGVLRPAQVELIRAHVQAAAAQGLKVRYWDTPAWPVKVREHVWDVLVKEGVGVLNVDDLEGMKSRRW